MMKKGIVSITIDDGIKSRSLETFYPCGQWSQLNH